MGQDERTEVLRETNDIFGSYLLLKRLAAGGMAEVFLARPASLDGNGRVQVVKRILPHVANDKVFLNMFQAEIQVILGFNHPHTVQLHDFGSFSKRPYIAMEYIEGKNLKEVIRKVTAKGEKIPIPMTLSMISQAASGLSYAHTFSNKVTGEVVNAIHRDISPHNLMVTYEGNLKVIDFGIAKAASSIQEATSVGTIKGKMAYLSPEQINGKPVDARSDVFALGIVAWELLTLTRAFIREGDTDFTIISRIDDCEKNILPPSSVDSTIPPELDQVVMTALKKNPADRFASAKDFQIALRQVMVKYYPNYSYSDAGAFVSSLFEQEIEVERKELRDLNDRAQAELVRRLESSTQIPLVESSFRPMMTNGVQQAPVMDNVDNRLMKIEAMMKQKAATKHYVLLAFYTLAVFAIQLEDRFSIVSNMFRKDDVQIEEQIAAQPKSTHRNQTQALAISKKRKTASVASSPKAVRKNSAPARVADKNIPSQTKKR